MSIRVAVASATVSAFLTLVRLRADVQAPVLRATAYVGRTFNSQTYASQDYFLEDYAGSWAWQPD